MSVRPAAELRAPAPARDKVRLLADQHTAWALSDPAPKRLFSCELRERHMLKNRAREATSEPQGALRADEPALPRRRPLYFWRFGVAGLLLVVLLGPFINRELRLAGLPDIGEPFDTAPFAHVDVPARENAFELYSLATYNLMPMASKVAYGDDDLRNLTWSAVIPEGRVWLEQNRAALDLYRQGSDRRHALYHQPASLTINSNFHVSNGLRELARLARLEALRLEDAGDCQEAWQWHRAVLRSSRHSGMHGCLIERLIGVTLQRVGVEGIMHWATRPEVNAAMLQNALEEVRAIDAMTGLPSESLKVEYLVYCKSNNVATVAAWVDPLSYEGQFLAVPLLPWLYGEPEMSRRVGNLVWANVLSQCDKPAARRTPATKAHFYTPTPGSPPVGGISPEEIEKWLKKTVLAKELLPGLWTTAFDRERARQEMLELVLTLELYHRERGEFPENLSALVGRGIDRIPLDPFGKGTPIRYRHEADPDAGAIVWSMGPNEVDDDGLDELMQQGSQKGDMVLYARPPRAMRAPAAD